MNKKFLSAILFGALMVTSTGTFVSCKDYDDDIDSLNEKVDKLTKDLSELQAAAGKYVTAVKYDAATGKLTVTGGNGETFQLPMPAELPTYSLKVVDGKIQLLDGDKVVSEATLPTTDVPATFDPTLLKWNNGYLYYGDVKISGVEKPQSVGSITEVKDEETGEVIGYVIELDGKSATFSLVADLKALVFQPAFYYQGIEAMEAIGLNYKTLTVAKVDADGNYDKDAPVVGEATTMIPDLVADYHVNPTVAKVPGDVKAYTFLRYDKNYTRSAATAPKVVKTNVTNGKAPKGILTVNAHFTDADIKNIENDEQVTVLALQVSKGDTVVTSDYAAVKAAYYKDLVLAAVDSIHANDRHLFTTAAEAIADNEHVCKIVWNSNGIDIARLVNTHRTNIDKEGTHSKWDVRAADGTVEKYGFKYSYELVGYHKGNNETSESAHAALKGSVIRPQMTSGGKQQPWGFTQNKATKDREPLVRVILTDTISGKIASVGYLKFKITDTANQNEVVLTPNFPFANGYTVDCTETETKLGLSWHQVEEQILAQLEEIGISKDEFHKNFKLDGAVEDVEQQALVNATQYDGITVDSKAVTTPVGVVSQTNWDPADEMTEVLTWVVKNNQAYHIFKAGAKSIAVNVRYSYEVSEGVYQYVYVTFTWTPSPLNFTPNGTIENSAKIDKYWYEKNGAVAGSGYSDIHANVHQVVSDNSNDCTFDSEILNTFTGNVITVTSDATYPAFANDKLTKEVVFANPQDHLTKKGTAYVVNGASGAQYDITVSADGKTLQATNKAVTKAVVVLAGTVMEYQENDFAKDILNNADHNLLGQNQTFTAKLQINAANCDYVDYALGNNVFYAKYLRPVSVDPSDVDELIDATNGASIAGLTLNLIDWRDKYFDKAEDTTGDDGKKYNFYGFYGVTKVAADIENATTTLNGGTLGSTKLSSVTKNVKLYFGEDKSTTNVFTALKVGDNGKFYYYNNGTTLGQFTIRVPLEVTYKWGTIYTEVDLNINKTIQN